MKSTIDRNMLKYSAGANVFCPHCDKIADYRKWAIVWAGENTLWQGCETCFAGIIPPHDAEVTKLFGEKKPKKAKTKEDLNKLPAKYFRPFVPTLRDVQNEGAKRRYPYGDAPAITIPSETVADDGTVVIDFWHGCVSTPLQTNRYVAEFCKMNKLCL